MSELSKKTSEKTRPLFKERLNSLLTRAGWNHFSWVPLEKPPTFDVYTKWLKEGLHGDMDYLVRHAPQKEDPRKILSNAQSALVFTVDYWPHPRPTGCTNESSLKIARYARGEDYHHWLKEKLQETVALLKTEFPDEEFRAFTDSGPVLERDLAYRAGLGWIGKNTCLIEEGRGSLFFIAEILTTLSFEGKTPTVAADRCGTCTKCLDACPTQALLPGKKLDARKCISYWTIEAKDAPPAEKAQKFEGWYFGCDICQTVCPWNEKPFRFSQQDSQEIQRLSTSGDPVGLDPDHRRRLCAELEEILTSSHKKLEKRWSGTPLSRARPLTQKRSALRTVAYYRLTELRPHVELLINDTYLGETARLTLQAFLP